MKPSRKYSPVISCLLKCECKNEDCFYGNDPCACNLSNPCPVNYTMNRVTGGKLLMECWVNIELQLISFRDIFQNKKEPDQIINSQQCASHPAKKIRVNTAYVSMSFCSVRIVNFRPCVQCMQ